MTDSKASPRDLRIGVYICHCGGNISDVVDCPKVVEAAAGFDDVVVSREHSFMCSDPAQEMIIEDIRKQGLNRVVIASCSPSLHELTFRRTVERGGLNPFLYEHANIREQVSWVHGSRPEEATAKAIRLVRAAVGKVRLLTAEERIGVEVLKRALVVGGGLAGLRAAKSLADQGIEVTLVEASPFLGGHTAQLEHLFPHADQARELMAPLLRGVADSSRIEVLTRAKVVGVEGYFGNFQVELEVQPRHIRGPLPADKLAQITEACPKSAPSEFDYGLRERKAIYMPYPGCVPEVPAVDMQSCSRCGKCEEILGADAVDFDEQARRVKVDAGCVLMATGFKPYEPYKGELGYGELEGVVTLAQFIRILGALPKDAGELEVGGRKIQSVALIHCVGSREIDGVHDPSPHRPLRTYCSRVCCSASLHAASEIRERFPGVNVFELYRDIRSYGFYEEVFERASRNRVVFLKYSDYEIPVVKAGNGEAALSVVVNDQLTGGKAVDVPVDLVVLASAMEPGDAGEIVGLMKLPIGSDGFLLEVHPKLRPVELAVEGVMVAGTAQAPMSTDETSAAACAAAAKAARILTRDEIPLDPFVARVDLSRCQGEGLCVAQCGYDGALQLEEIEQDGEKVKRASVNAVLCKGCGACVAVCPHRAIDIVGCTLDQLYRQVDGLCA
ncbi:MAG: CoB--CoM heterodisulfide reductase iron-sulfur subunit A family protein [Deltaproteobacteria bacterium]|nr:CoB--CoM heterodisulfide reductase iron-sulfur subunit A family protein [Deltaproteobacteria bacterium]